MKRIAGLILTAVFLSALCIPCAATDTGRAYPGFSDVAEGSASYEAIKLCYERGLMNGTSDTAFNPQGKLNVAQLVVLAARLYNLQNGGDGTVPDLPDLSQPYLRFYDSEGNLFASFNSAQELQYNAGEQPYISLSNAPDAPDAPDLPETCKLEIGFEDYGQVRSFEGVKESHESAGGTMHQGFVGTGYRFADPEARRFAALPNRSLMEQFQETWWFPAAFYLGIENVLHIEGELFYRASNGNNGDDSGYDPAVRFSKDNATRSLFAWLVERTAGELEILNETVDIPDINPDETQDAAAILRLYQAGVLTGVDQAGNFGGGKELTRAQAAIMMARVLEPSLRVKSGG
nr:S-layer homology domain-containing protein [uncultured Oscillibacter sp.]